MNINDTVDFDIPAGLDVASVAAAMGKTPTEEQIAACVGANQPGPMTIKAYAGAAKTTTLRLLSGIQPHVPMIYMCFNKAIAEESTKVFPQNVKCATTHSVAYRAMNPTYGYNKTQKMTSSLRTRDVVTVLNIKDQPILGGTAKLDANTIGYAVLRTVTRFCQSADLSVETHHFDNLPKFQTLEKEDFYPIRDMVVNAAATLWSQMIDPRSPVGLGHDGYVKAWHLSEPTIDYPVILVDEGQDTNPVLLAVLERQTHAQVIMVGDQHQSIYEWRGAINAMDSIPGAREFRLTKSFRFGHQIAAAANNVLHVLGETVPLVGNEHVNDNIVARVSPGTQTIICRTNAEILSRLLIELENNSINRCFVQGGVADMLAILDGVEALKNKRKSYHPLFIGFETYDEFTSYAEKSGDGEANKVVKLVAKHSLYKLKEALRSVLPQEDDALLTLTTGHKSKGREWHRVTLADDFKEQPEKTEDGETKHNVAETRLFYVAMTRAQHELALPYWAHRTYGIALPAGKEDPNA
jgi:superfamily I DNA/RNA helicase